MSHTEALARTPLYKLHLELGARIVPFAGYEMPVQYPSGIIKEHLHTRGQAGLFDVSHMGQARLSGPQAAAALETLVPVDLIDLPAGGQRYALFTDERGGILDDLMVANSGDSLFVVVNAACKRQDIAHLRAHLSDRCRIEELADRALLALQGPAAAAVMARLAPETAKMVFMTHARATLLGAPCFISRSGYTGEDGFEISVPAEKAEALARWLLAQPEVAPIGLGARDSLRLEAGLCLYGHDIDATTTPVEAGLVWALSKARRRDGARPGGYPGADIIFRQLADGVARKRVGLLPAGKMPVRDGAELVDAGDRAVGRVTSGGFGPTLGGPVAMAYVESASSAPGTPLNAIVRGKPVPVEVAKTPFVAQRYYRG
ncbi:MAG: glycine cleavage system aminomethyltransferase GcvT [Candidatus Competibacteraceae bacterium]|nr:glycine cleavage system aminomethyltransferase GcvT [Candidatus Competibacteraceae bacterium]